jgi:hypothetical protein
VPEVVKVSALESEAKNRVPTNKESSDFLCENESSHPFRAEDEIVKLAEIFTRLQNNSVIRGRAYLYRPFLVSATEHLLEVFHVCSIESKHGNEKRDVIGDNRAARILEADSSHRPIALGPGGVPDPQLNEVSRRRNDQRQKRGAIVGSVLESKRPSAKRLTTSVFSTVAGPIITNFTSFSGCERHSVSAPFFRGVGASFSTTIGSKTLEFGVVSLSNDLIRYKIESFYLYLI